MLLAKLLNNEVMFVVLRVQRVYDLPQKRTQRFNSGEVASNFPNVDTNFTGTSIVVLGLWNDGRKIAKVLI